MKPIFIDFIHEGFFKKKVLRINVSHIEAVERHEKSNKLFVRMQSGRTFWCYGWDVSYIEFLIKKSQEPTK